MDNSPASACLTDRQGKIIYLSKSYYRMFHLAADAVGKTVHEVLSPGYADQFLANIQTASDENRVLEAIAKASRPDQMEGEFLVYNFPLFDSTGACLIGGIALDITASQPKS